MSPKFYYFNRDTHLNRFLFLAHSAETTGF